MNIVKANIKDIKAGDVIHVVGARVRVTKSYVTGNRFYKVRRLKGVQISGEPLPRSFVDGRGEFWAVGHGFEKFSVEAA